MNVICNQHIPSNLRIILINNGKGTEFRNFNHGAAIFGDDADKYMAAAGHFGNKSKSFVKDFVVDLGFKYISAQNKEQCIDGLSMLCLSPMKNQEVPILLEIFTNNEDESDALYYLYHLEKGIQSIIKKILSRILPSSAIMILKKLKTKM